MCFPRVDANDGGIGSLADFFAQVADGGDGSASAKFDDYHGTLAVLVQEGIEVLFLGVAALVEPGVVFKHQDIWARDALAARAVRNCAGAHGGCVDIKAVLIGADGIAAAGGALQVMDGAVNLPYVIGVKACALELTIYVGGGDKVSKRVTLYPPF